MASKIMSSVLLCCALFAAVCHADVSSLRYDRFGRPITSTTRLQRQEVAATPYPAAGYRPDRQFALPGQFFPAQSQPEANLNGGNGAAIDEESLQRPELTYGAPARLRQLPARQQLQPQPRNYAAPQQAYATAAAQQTFAEPPQQTYGAPAQASPVAAAEPQAERLTALKSARLSDNREDQEDEEDVETNVEADEKMEEKKAVAAAPPAAATVAYYPAGALNFVQPFSAYVQPGTAYNAAAANYYAKLQVQPAAYVGSAPLTAGASSASVAPFAQLTQFAQPQQAFGSPFFQQQFAYAAPAQLQAW